MSKLLTRDEFRNAVFERDKHTCVMCGLLGQDAHHIIERRLFPDGGYYLDNGATLCGPCHIKAEQTLPGYAVETIRYKARITTVIVPPHLYPDESYDKWGNPVMDNGMRLRGELFNDPSVQKVLQPVMRQFTSYVKFPRTVHLPGSPGMHDDDRVIDSLDDLKAANEIIVTEKLDGENTTMYRDYIHARSINGMNHPSQGWVKNFHAKIAFEIPDGWRITGENLFATHAIKYKNLESYFYGFGIWNERNECLPWSDTVQYFEMLGIVPVPVIRRCLGGILEDVVKHLAEHIQRVNNTPGHIGRGYPFEGFVVRDAGAFSYRQYRTHVAKWVRANHVAQGHNWRQAWNGERNGLADNQ